MTGEVKHNHITRSRLRDEMGFKGRENALSRRLGIGEHLNIFGVKAVAMFQQQCHRSHIGDTTVQSIATRVGVDAHQQGKFARGSLGVDPIELVRLL